MDEIDQKKFDAIRHVILTCNENWDDYTIAKAILSALKQFDPEPLEVEFLESSTVGGSRLRIPNWFRTKEQALEFAEKKGLKVRV